MDRLTSTVSRDIVAFWRALPRQGRVPRRAAVDPSGIPSRLLPHVFLCGVARDPFRVTVRLQGTFLNDQTGQRNMTWREIDRDHFGAGWDRILSVYREVCLSEKPIATHERVTLADGREIVNEVVHLPLAAEHGDISFVFGTLDRIEPGPDPLFTAAEATEWRIEQKFHLD